MAQGSLKKKVPPVKTKQKSVKRASESNAKTRKGAHMLPKRAGEAQSSRRHILLKRCLAAASPPTTTTGVELVGLTHDLFPSPALPCCSHCRCDDQGPQARNATAGAQGGARADQGDQRRQRGAFYWRRYERARREALGGELGRARSLRFACARVRNSRSSWSSTGPCDARFLVTLCCLPASCGHALCSSRPPSTPLRTRRAARRSACALDRCLGWGGNR